MTDDDERRDKDGDDYYELRRREYGAMTNDDKRWIALLLGPSLNSLGLLLFSFVDYRTGSEFL
uniref:Uncharacterized protein n=1 Tax=Cucumis melo TaxID=3656 RepID=A0A9I9DL23_CUCME